MAIGCSAAPFGDLTSEPLARIAAYVDYRFVVQLCELSSITMSLCRSDRVAIFEDWAAVMQIAQYDDGSACTGSITTALPESSVPDFVVSFVHIEPVIMQSIFDYTGCTGPYPSIADDGTVLPPCAPYTLLLSSASQHMHTYLKKARTGYLQFWDFVLGAHEIISMTREDVRA
jgi:hypothetical protein